MKVPLWVGNLNALFFECLEDHEIEFAPEHARHSGVLFCPDAEYEIEGTIPELLQQRIRFWVLQHTDMLIGDLKKQPADEFSFRLIGCSTGKLNHTLRSV